MRLQLFIVPYVKVSAFSDVTPLTSVKRRHRYEGPLSETVITTQRRIQEAPKRQSV
jgi:hypothetical protein